MASSRISWYWRSVSVWAGATVIESPVCTPIGSRFSIEQTTTKLSLQSRMTSSSYSFQPSTGLLEEHLLDRAHLEGRVDAGAKLLIVVGDAAAGAAEREGRAHDDREARARGTGLPVAFVGDDDRAGEVDADLLHALLEQLAVLGLADGLQTRADDLDAVALQDAPLGGGHGEVERGLAAQGGQDGLGRFALDDLLEVFRGQRLDVGAVGELGVGHDRGRVGVDQADLVALFAQGLDALRAGVVELAALAR